MRLPYTFKIPDLLIRRNFEALEQNQVPQFMAYLNTTTGNILTTATFTKVVYDTLAEDYSDGAFSLANDEFTVKEPGAYYFGGSCFPSTNLSDTVRAVLALYKNGSEHRRLQDICQGKAESGLRAGGTYVRAKRGDVFQLRYYHEQGSTIAELGSSAGAFCYFNGIWLSP